MLGFLDSDKKLKFVLSKIYYHLIFMYGFNYRNIMVFNVSRFLNHLRTIDDPQMSHDTIDRLEDLLKHRDILHSDHNCDEYGNSLLGLICKYNEYCNIQVLDYLIKECGMDLNHRNNCGYSILGLACVNIHSVRVIEYLIKGCRLKQVSVFSPLIDDLNRLNYFGRTILSSACTFNESINVIKYLMEIREIQIQIDGLTFDRCKNLIAMQWKDHDKFNQLIVQCVDQHGTDVITGIIDQINPLTLGPMVREKLCLPDPFALRFDKFRQLVDDLKMCVRILEPESDPDLTESFDPIPGSDDQKEIIFIHNQMPYHGNPRIAFSALELTRGMDELLHFQEPILLTSDLSHDPMVQWVGSIDKKMDIMRIGPGDLISLLNHINKYPTTGTNLTSIEYDLIEYLETMRSQFNPLNLRDFAKSCRMKLLYLYLHNIKMGYGTQDH
jgi:hypothetical protein